MALPARLGVGDVDARRRRAAPASRRRGRCGRTPRVRRALSTSFCSASRPASSLGCASWAWLALTATVGRSLARRHPSSGRGPWRLPIGATPPGARGLWGRPRVSGALAPGRRRRQRPAHHHAHGVGVLSRTAPARAGGGPPPTGAGRARGDTDLVTVRPGDTLWAIAERDLPAGAPTASSPRAGTPSTPPTGASSAPTRTSSSPGSTSTSQPCHERTGHDDVRRRPAPVVSGHADRECPRDARPRPRPPTRRAGAGRLRAARASGSMWSPSTSCADVASSSTRPGSARRWSRSSAATGRSRRCSAGRLRRSTRTSPAAPTSSPRPRGAVRERGHPVRPSPARRRPHQLRLRDLRRGQPARALRTPLPRGRGQVRADPRPLAGVCPGVRLKRVGRGSPGFETVAERPPQPAEGPGRAVSR